MKQCVGRLALGLVPILALSLVQVSGAQGSPSPISEFSAGITAGSYPTGITTGPDGNLWFLELNARIAKITPSGVITEYTLPGVDGNGVNSITTGPDGNLWFTSRSGIDKLTPNGTYTEYTVNNAVGHIVAGPDGRLWFTTSGNSSGHIGAITTTGQVTYYTTGILGFPDGITAGPDGNLWFTTAESVGSITTSGSVTRYTAGLTGAPSALTAGPDGNLWVTENGDLVAKVTTGGVVTEYRVGPPDGSSGPFGITAGPDGNLWFTGGETASNISGDRIGSMTTSGVVTNYTTGISGGPLGITAGPDGNLWFTEYGGGRIGRLNLNAATSTTTTSPVSLTGPTKLSTKTNLSLSTTTVNHAHEQTVRMTVVVSSRVSGAVPIGTVKVRAVFSTWANVNIGLCVIKLSRGRGSCSLPASALNPMKFPGFSGYASLVVYDFGIAAYYLGSSKYRASTSQLKPLIVM